MHVKATWGFIKTELCPESVIHYVIFRSCMMKYESLTFISVCHNDARHEFLLAVGPEGVSDHDLVLRQLALQFQGILPVELDLGCQTFRRGTVQKP